MVVFNGNVKLKIIEAIELRPTDFAIRHNLGGGHTSSLRLDPYISIDIDDKVFGRTTTKFKSQKNVWNEDFTTEAHNGQNLNITVFHDAAIPPDEFVANCAIDLAEMVGKPSSDIWVKLFLTFNQQRVLLIHKLFFRSI